MGRAPKSKQELIEEMKAQTLNINKSSEQSDNISVDYKNLYKEKKKENEKLSKQLKNKETLLKQKGINENKLLSNISNLRNEKNILHDELLDTTSEVDSLKESIIRLESEIKKIQLQNETLAKELDYYKKDCQRYKDRGDSLKRELDSFKSETKINELKKINNNNIKLIDSLEKSNKKLQLRLSQYKEQKDSLSLLPTSEIIDTLIERLNVYTIGDFGKVVPLHSKYFRVRKLKRSIKKINNQDLNNEFEILYGIFDIESNTFTTLEGDSYNVIKKPDYTFNSNLKPCSVKLIDSESVEILYIYSHESDMEIDVQHSKQRRKKKLDDGYSHEGYENLGEYNVLIVAGLNGVKHRDTLKKYGLNASWIDPFEKSELHVKNEMLKSDIVLLFYEHMPHSVNDFIEDDDIKYQYVNADNEEFIVNKIKSIITRIQSNLSQPFIEK